jgi:hypothetical protein
MKITQISNITIVLKLLEQGIPKNHIAKHLCVSHLLITLAFFGNKLNGILVFTPDFDIFTWLSLGHFVFVKTGSQVFSLTA